MCDISPMEMSLRLANTRKQSVASSICPIERERELFCGVPSFSRGICSYNFCLVHIIYYCVIFFLYINVVPKSVQTESSELAHCRTDGAASAKRCLHLLCRVASEVGAAMCRLTSQSFRLQRYEKSSTKQRNSFLFFVETGYLRHLSASNFLAITLSPSVCWGDDGLIGKTVKGQLCEE